MPWRSRTRVCRPSEFGGKQCSVLENEAKKANQTLYKEKQVCSQLPVCPTPASLGPWSAWSTCGQTCYAEGTNPPQRSRERSCKKASLSTDEKLNDDIQTCENLGGAKMYKPCDINACPGDFLYFITLPTSIIFTHHKHTNNFAPCSGSQVA